MTHEDKYRGPDRVVLWSCGIPPYPHQLEDQEKKLSEPEAVEVRANTTTESVKVPSRMDA